MSALEPIEYSQELSVSSPPLQVCCYALADRTGHSICIASTDKGSFEILRSVEGDSSQDFPPSGVFQEIVLEDASVGKLPALMGLGSAGKSTWSCSIEADATIEAVAFDFACKTRASDWLGSTYRIAAGISCQQVSSQIVNLSIDDQMIVTVRCFGDATLGLDQSSTTLTVNAGVPASDAPQSVRSPRRWRYVAGLASSLEFASDRDDRG